MPKGVAGKHLNWFPLGLIYKLVDRRATQDYLISPFLFKMVFCFVLFLFFYGVFPGSFLAYLETTLLAGVSFCLVFLFTLILFFLYVLISCSLSVIIPLSFSFFSCRSHSLLSFGNCLFLLSNYKRKKKIERKNWR